MVRNIVRVTDLVTVKKSGGVMVQLVGRDTDGQRCSTSIRGTHPYAFVPNNEAIPKVDWIQYVKEGYHGHDGRPLTKVAVTYPEHLKRLKKHFSVLYEDDIPYYRRLSSNYGLSGYIDLPKGDIVHIDDVNTDIDPAEIPNINPRIMMADIEVNPPDMSKGDFDYFVEHANEPITAIATYDSYDDEYLVLVLDPEDKVDGGDVRHYLEDHWDGHSDKQKYTQATMRLVQCGTEEALIRKFIEEIEAKRPDVISGWNWIDFDHEYILNRLEHFDNIDTHRLSDIGDVGGYKMSRKIDGLPGFDMMGAFCDKMSFSQWRSRRLDYVANEELAIGKVEDMDLAEEYQNNRSRFIAYNIIDTQLLVGLDDRHGIHEFFYLLADLSGVQIYDTFSEMRLVDGFVLSRRTDHEILPSNKDKDLDSIAGGLVLAPSDGVHEWVAVFDLKSLYPSIIVTLNVSEETLTTIPAGEAHTQADIRIKSSLDQGSHSSYTVKTEQGADFMCPGMPENEDEVPGLKITEEDISWDIDTSALGIRSENEGILPKYLKLLFSERNDMKAIRNSFDPDDPEFEVWDNKQGAVKVIMNSFYGVSQNDYYRLADPTRGSQGIGSTITAGGRYVLWRGSQIAEEMGFEVKYGDTDSIMIKIADSSEGLTPQEIIDRGMEIEAELNERMDEVADEFGIGEKHPFLKDADLHGNDRHCLKWEFEKMYRRFFQAGTKKRYAGLPVWKEGKWFIDPENGDINMDDVEPDITGFESKRSDVPPITEETQKSVIKRVLGGQEFDDLSDYLAEVSRRVRTGEIEQWKLAAPGVINKPLYQYGNTPTIRACRFSNEHLTHDWREGDNPWVYFVKETPPMIPDTDVIALEWGEDIPEGYVLDIDKIIRKKIQNPLEPILGETGWSFEELESGKEIERVDVGGGGGNPFADMSMDGDIEEDTTDIEEDKTESPESGAMSW